MPLNPDGLTYKQLADLIRGYYPNRYEYREDEDLVNEFKDNPDLDLDWDNIINEPTTFYENKILPLKRELLSFKHKILQNPSQIHAIANDFIGATLGMVIQKKDEETGEFVNPDIYDLFPNGGKNFVELTGGFGEEMPPEERDSLYTTDDILQNINTQKEYIVSQGAPERGAPGYGEFINLVKGISDIEEMATSGKDIIHEVGAHALMQNEADYIKYVNAKEGLWETSQEDAEIQNQPYHTWERNNTNQTWRDVFAHQKIRANADFEEAINKDPKLKALKNWNENSMHDESTGKKMLHTTVDGLMQYAEASAVGAVAAVLPLLKKRPDLAYKAFKSGFLGTFGGKEFMGLMEEGTEYLTADKVVDESQYETMMALEEESIDKKDLTDSQKEQALDLYERSNFIIDYDAQGNPSYVLQGLNAGDAWFAQSTSAYAGTAFTMWTENLSFNAISKMFGNKGHEWVGKTFSQNLMPKITKTIRSIPGSKKMSRIASLHSGKWKPLLYGPMVEGTEEGIQYLGQIAAQTNPLFGYKDESFADEFELNEFAMSVWGGLSVGFGLGITGSVYQNSDFGRRVDNWKMSLNKADFLQSYAQWNPKTQKWDAMGSSPVHKLDVDTGRYIIDKKTGMPVVDGMESVVLSSHSKFRSAYNAAVGENRRFTSMISSQSPTILKEYIGAKTHIIPDKDGGYKVVLVKKDGNPVNIYKFDSKKSAEKFKMSEDNTIAHVSHRAEEDKELAKRAEETKAIITYDDNGDIIDVDEAALYLAGVHGTGPTALSTTDEINAFENDLKKRNKGKDFERNIASPKYILSQIKERGWEFLNAVGIKKSELMLSLNDMYSETFPEEIQLIDDLLEDPTTEETTEEDIEVPKVTGGVDIQKDREGLAMSKDSKPITKHEKGYSSKYIQSEGGLIEVSGKEVTLEGTDRPIFVYQNKDGDYSVIDARTGLSFGKTDFVAGILPQDIIDTAIKKGTWKDEMRSAEKKLHEKKAKKKVPKKKVPKKKVSKKVTEREEDEVPERDDARERIIDEPIFLEEDEEAPTKDKRYEKLSNEEVKKEYLKSKSEKGVNAAMKALRLKAELKARGLDIPKVTKKKVPVKKVVKKKASEVKVTKTGIKHIVSVGGKSLSKLTSYVKGLISKTKGSFRKGGNHKAVWFGPIPYKYTGAVHTAKKMPDGLIKIKHRIESLLGLEQDYFDSVLINEYEPGIDLPAHQDNEDILRLLDGSIGAVGTLSLGGTTILTIKDKKGVVETIEVKNGDIYELPAGDFQDTYYHGVGPSKGKRISLTFRRTNIAADIKAAKKKAPEVKEDMVAVGSLTISRKKAEKELADIKASPEYKRAKAKNFNNLTDIEEQHARDMATLYEDALAKKKAPREVIVSEVPDETPEGVSFDKEGGLIIKKSMISGKKHQMYIPGLTKERYDSWKAGKLIQDVFPELTAGEREFLINGITPVEFDEEFKESAEEDAEDAYRISAWNKFIESGEISIEAIANTLSDDELIDIYEGAILKSKKDNITLISLGPGYTRIHGEMAKRGLLPKVSKQRISEALRKAAAKERQEVKDSYKEKQKKKIDFVKSTLEFLKKKFVTKDGKQLFKYKILSGEEQNKKENQFKGKIDWDSNTVIINPKFLSEDTGFHEISHPFIRAISKTEGGLEIIDSIYNEIIGSKAGQKIYDKILKRYVQKEDIPKIKEDELYVDLSKVNKEISALEKDIKNIPNKDFRDEEGDIKPKAQKLIDKLSELKRKKKNIERDINEKGLREQEIAAESVGEVTEEELEEFHKRKAKPDFKEGSYEFKEEVIAEALGKAASDSKRQPEFKQKENPIIQAVKSFWNALKKLLLGKDANINLTTYDFIKDGITLKDLVDFLTDEEQVLTIDGIKNKVKKEVSLQRIENPRLSDSIAINRIFQGAWEDINILNLRETGIKANVHPERFRKAMIRALTGTGLEARFDKWFQSRFGEYGDIKWKNNAEGKERETMLPQTETSAAIISYLTEMDNREGGKLEDLIDRQETDEKEISRGDFNYLSEFGEKVETTLAKEMNRRAYEIIEDDSIPNDEKYMVWVKESLEKIGKRYNQLLPFNKRQSLKKWNRLFSSVTINSEVGKYNNRDNLYVLTETESIIEDGIWLGSKVIKMTVKPKGPNNLSRGGKNNDSDKTTPFEKNNEEGLITWINGKDFLEWKKSFFGLGYNAEFESISPEEARWKSRFNFFTYDELLTLEEQLNKKGYTIVMSRGDSDKLAIVAITEEHRKKALAIEEYVDKEIKQGIMEKNKRESSIKALSEGNIAANIAAHEALKKIFPNYLTYFEAHEVGKRFKLPFTPMTISNTMPDVDIYIADKDNLTFKFDGKEWDGIYEIKTKEGIRKVYIGDGGSLTARKLFQKFEKHHGLVFGQAKAKTVIYQNKDGKGIAIKHQHYQVEPLMEIWEGDVLIAKVDKNGNFVEGVAKGKDMIVTKDEAKWMYGIDVGSSITVTGQNIGFTKYADEKISNNANHMLQWYNHVTDPAIIDAFKRIVLDKVKKNTLNIYRDFTDGKTKGAAERIAKVVSKIDVNSPIGFRSSLVELNKLGFIWQIEPMLSVLYQNKKMQPNLSLKENKGTQAELVPNLRGDLERGEVALSKHNAKEVLLKYATANNRTIAQANREIDKVNAWLEDNPVHMHVSRSPVPHIGGTMMVRVKRLYNRKGTVEMNVEDVFARLEGDFDGDWISLEMLPWTYGQKVETIKRYDVQTLRNNREKTYLFGDNLAGYGKGGQAIIRGEPNAIGIPTKKKPTMDEDAFMTDDEYDSNIRAIDEAFNKIPKNKIIVLPQDGLGTGLARLQSKAPKTWAYLQSKLAEFKSKETFVSEMEDIYLDFFERLGEIEGINLDKYDKKVTKLNMLRKTDRLKLTESMTFNKQASIVNIQALHGMLSQTIEHFIIDGNNIVVKSPDEIRPTKMTINGKPVKLPISKILRIYVQAAVDNIKYGLLQAWNYNQEELERSLFKYGKGHPKEGKNISIEHFYMLKPYLKFLKQAATIRRGREQETSFDLTQVIELSEDYYRYAQDKESYVKNKEWPVFRKRDEFLNKGMIQIKLKTEELTPSEEIAIVPYEQYVAWMKRDNIVGTVGSPIKLHYNVHRHAHTIAKEYIKNNEIIQAFLDEALIKDGKLDLTKSEKSAYLKKEMTKGRVYGQEMSNAFYALIAMKRKNDNEGTINPTFMEYDEDMVLIKQKFNEQYKNLSEVAKIGATYKFLIDIKVKTIKNKKDFPLEAPKWIPPASRLETEFQLLHEDVLVAYVEVYNEQAAKNRNMDTRFNKGEDLMINDVIEDMCK